MKKTKNISQNTVVIGVIIALSVLFSIFSPSFRQYSTVVTLFSYMYYILLLAIGVTFPLITGGVDLSTGTGLVCFSIISSYMFNHAGLPLWVAIIAAPIMGIISGAFNGLMIAKYHVPPFIATLSMSMILRGLGSIIPGGLTGVWPSQGSDGDWIRSVLRYQTEDGLIIPIGVIWMIIIIGIMTFVLKHTKVGRYTIGIGSNRTALSLSGVNVLKYQVIVYAISGFFTGLAALAYGWTFTTITPGTGAGFELDAIGGAIIGGVSTTGGKGTIVGAAIGVILISLLKTGLPHVGLQANAQQIITGAILMLAVAVDMIREKNN